MHTTVAAREPHLEHVRLLLLRLGEVLRVVLVVALVRVVRVIAAVRVGGNRLAFVHRCLCDRGSRLRHRGHSLRERRDCELGVRHVLGEYVCGRRQVPGGGADGLRGGHLAGLDAKLGLLVGRTVVKVRLELGAALVERDAVAEISDRGVGRDEGEAMRDEANRAHRVPAGASISNEGAYNDLTYHTPTNSMSTFMENAFLNAMLCCQPVSSHWVYILYANGTCWWLPAGKSPTLWSIPARDRAVYEPREKPKRHILSPA